MNETINTLLSRRSCRSFDGKQITDEQLNAILEAGKFAPTGMGKQSPIMVVLQDKDDIAELSRMNAAITGVDTDPFYGAPTVVIVLADKNVGTYIYDGSLVMGNMLNAAHALGLGSCWIHRAKETFNTDDGKKLLKDLGVEGDYEGIGNCVIGYAAEEREPKPRKEKFVYYIK